MTEQRQNIPAKRWTCKHWYSGQHANASEPCGYCALEAEVEALRKDAERMRWCIVHKTFPKVTQSVTSSSLDFWSVVVEKNGHRIRVDAPTPEAAIDAAMALRPGEKG